MGTGIGPGFFVRSENRALRDIIRYSTDVAATPYTVLIEGETGTGKELFARGIHAASGRPGPFVPVNCSAVPESMFEAELFGARRGAYTGLDVDRLGLFRLAHRGTLFLDEVADLPSPMQAKLLRVLEDGEIRPLGGATPVQVDVRVVSATHKDLAPLVDCGQFRSDLFFRLSPARIVLPALRERVEDIPALAADAVAAACRVQRIPIKKLSDAALGCLCAYDWPGNVRELRNALAAAVLHTSGAVIDAENLPPEIVHGGREAPPALAVEIAVPFFDALRSFERGYMHALLARADGNISQAARLCGLSRATVRKKAREYGLLAGPAAPAERSRVRIPRSSKP